MRRVVALFLFFAAAMAAAGPASAATRATDPAADARRIALVVGNSAYQHVGRLDNPTKDAGSIAQTLTSLGFELVGGKAQLDLDKTAMEAAIRRFGDMLRAGGVGLFYYAGHGLQVRGVNYLVPVSANPNREADIDFELVDANLVLRQMEQASTKLNIVILDACRNNPFGGRGLRSVATGLAQMQAPEGTIISYATQPGNVALDGADGHSPFAKALMTTLATPGLNVLDTFNKVGVAVKRETGGSQQPWVSNSPIDGEFYFIGGGPAPAAGGPAAPPAPAPAAAPAAADAEMVFWESIAKSSDPADYRAYLETYPNGRFAALARVRGKAAPAESQPPQQQAYNPPQSAPAVSQPRNFARELTDFGVAPQTNLRPVPHGPTPLALPGGHVIATEQLFGMLQRNEAIAIDALSGTPHPTLPKTVWIPAAGAAGTFRDATQFAFGRVLATITQGNQNQPLVFFCEGAECWLSYNAALRAINLGYRNIYWYRGGLEAWTEAGLPTGAPLAVF